jgi:ubiquinone/menaquinone biosynthesis C-methylase UbiE
MIFTASDNDLPRLKSQLQETWMSGDYDRFSRYLEDGTQEFFQRLKVPRGARLLDVACGSGQLALIAAREGVKSTGVDIAPNWLDRARARSRAEGLEIDFREGDAEAIPFPDASFDVVATVSGSMFAPRPELVAAEMARVCRPGGVIAMVNWTPQGFIGEMFKTISRHALPPGVPSPLLWGEEGVVTERLGRRVSRLRMTRRLYTFDYPFPPASVVEFFRENYGPVVRAFANLDGKQRRALRADLDSLWTRHNLCCRGCTRVEAEYLEVVANP